MSGREESVAERCRVTVVVGLMLVVENGSVGGYSWHIGAAWRPLTFPCLSLSLSFFLSFVLSLFFFLSLSFALYRSIRCTPSFSVSSCSSSFLSRSRSLFLHHGTPLHLVLSARFPAAPCELAHEHTGIVYAHRSRPLSVDSFHFVSASFDPACLRSLRPLDTGIPLRSLPSMLRSSLRLLRLRFPPFPHSDVAESATTCIHLATKPPRRYSGPDDDKRETVH